MRAQIILDARKKTFSIEWLTGQGMVVYEIQMLSQYCASQQGKSGNLCLRLPRA